MRSRAVTSTCLSARIGLSAAIAAAMASAALVLAGAAPAVATQAAPEKSARDQDGAPASQKDATPQPKVKFGLSINEPGAFRGYTLLNPMNHKKTYLIDMDGRVVKTWESQHNSMHAAYLLENGHLFRVAVLEGGERAFGGGPGSAGRIQEFDWDGEPCLGLPVPQRQAILPPRRRPSCPMATSS